MNHIVALSGGKDSTAMALRLAEIEPREYEYIFTPTGNELSPMIEHWLTLGKLLGKPLKPVTTRRSLGGLIHLQQAIPNWRMRWCTRMLKIEPFQRYVLTHLPCVVYVGIRADEARDGVDYPDLAPLLVSQRFPLVEWGWGMADVVCYNSKRGVSIPERTDCAACFFQTLYEWWSLWKNHRDMYAQAEGWEDDIGHTFRSEQRDTWPASLRDLRGRFETGDIPVKRKMAERKVMCSVCAR